MSDTFGSETIVTDPPRETADRGESKLPSTHWLHLADGRVIESQGVMTHYKDIPVIRAVEIPVAPVADAHEF